MKRPDDRMLQDVITLFGDAAGGLAQNQPYYVNVSRANKVVVAYKVLKAVNAELYLQTSKVADKRHWRDTKTLTGSGSMVLTREAGLTEEFLENFLRWRVAGTDVDWQITFSIRVYGR